MLHWGLPSAFITGLLMMAVGCGTVDNHQWTGLQEAVSPSTRLSISWKHLLTPNFFPSYKRRSQKKGVCVKKSHGATWCYFHLRWSLFETWLKKKHWKATGIPRWNLIFKLVCFLNFFIWWDFCHLWTLVVLFEPKPTTFDRSHCEFLSPSNISRCSIVTLDTHTCTDFHSRWYYIFCDGMVINSVLLQVFTLLRVNFAGLKLHWCIGKPSSGKVSLLSGIPQITPSPPQTGNLSFF